MYKVKIDLFEGPFELLVYLIQHARMNVYDIQVSEITEQYLEYVDNLKKQDVDLAQEFMVLAAELIELKSRMLLPSSNVDPETGEEVDPRESLVARILEYKQYKDIAGFLDEQMEIMSHVHTKPQEDLSVYKDEPDELLTGSMDQFVKAFEAFLLKKQKLAEMKRTYERIERERISVENKMGELVEMFKVSKEIFFSEMIRKDTSIFNQVVTFMSLLELLKGGGLEAEQERIYGDIKVTVVDLEEQIVETKEEENGQSTN